EKLKKNEIKVTVIATGFPEESDHSTSSYNIARRAPSVSERLDNDTEEVVSRGKIFNSLPKKVESVKSEDMMTKGKPTPATENPKHHPKPNNPADDTGDEEDWGAVPAFLRRSKLK